MTLHDVVAAELPHMREQAESLMVDTVLVERATGTFTTDPVTLEEVPDFTEVYAGPGRVQRSGRLSSQDDVSGDFEFGVDSVLVQLPLSATGVKRDDRVTVTSLGAVSDPDLLGLVATVRANLTKTHPTKRTLVCEGVSDA